MLTLQDSLFASGYLYEKYGIIFTTFSFKEPNGNVWIRAYFKELGTNHIHDPYEAEPGSEKKTFKKFKTLPEALEYLVRAAYKYKGLEIED